MQNTDYDIIIVGVGFTGTILALSILRQIPKMKIALIEKNFLAGNIKNDGRNLTISSKSEKFLREIGINIFADSGRIEKIVVEDVSGKNIEFDSKGNMGFVIESHFILSQLMERVQNSSLDIYENFMISDIVDDGFFVHIGNLKTKLLLAADGKNSHIRKQFDFEVRGKSYNQTAILFNIHQKKPHNNIAYEKFTKTGPLAILPKKDSHHASVIWNQNTNIAKSLLEFDKSTMQNLFQKFVDDICGEVEIVSEIFFHELSLTYSKKYFKGRILLIGDALHSIHPVAGQGLNLTISDIEKFSNLLKEYYEAGMDIGSEHFLSVFEAERKYKNLAMIHATDKLIEIFDISKITVSLMRKFGFFSVNKLSLVKNVVVNFAGGD